MSILIFILAVFLLLGMAGVSLSLLELDRRLAELAQAMEGRYGVWMRQAEEKKHSKDVKNDRVETAVKAKSAAPLRK